MTQHRRLSSVSPTPSPLNLTAFEGLLRELLDVVAAERWAHYGVDYRRRHASDQAAVRAGGAVQAVHSVLTEDANRILHLIADVDSEVPLHGDVAGQQVLTELRWFLDRTEGLTQSFACAAEVRDVTDQLRGFVQRPLL